MPQDVFELPAPEGNTIVGHLLELSMDAAIYGLIRARRSQPEAGNDLLSNPQSKMV